MALIKCPECGKDVSDKAVACIHCGYPLASRSVESQPSKSAKDFLYQVELREYRQADKVKVIKVICEVTGMGLADAKRFSESLPGVVMKGLTVDECEKIKDLFNEVNATASITADNVSKTHNPVFNSRPLRTVGKKAQGNDTVVCPKCGSSAISTGARGLSMTWGLIGAGQTVNRCANCGHKWKPKQGR